MDARDPLAGIAPSRLEEALAADGCALLPGLLDDAQVRALLALEASPSPPFLEPLLASLHRRLEPLAGRWRAALDEGRAGEATGRAEPKTPRASPADPIGLDRLHAGGYRPLRTGLDDGVESSFLLMVLLAEPGRDFTGGELVLAEQRPRQQSRPIVVPLRRGDAALVAAGVRPCRGSRGGYRVRIRHAVAPVRTGERLGVTVCLRCEG